MTEEQVFLAALELPGSAGRTAYLDQVCGTDVEFRRRVEELLAAHFKPGPFLDQPLAEQMAAGPATPTDETTADLHADRGDDVVTGEKKPEEGPNDLSFLQPPRRADALGRIGHYEVLEVLGKGGFGIVLRAFDETLERVVAVKVLAPAIAATSPARKRFLREARSAAQVRHEHVVQVHAVEEQPLPYLVMDFIPGETLQQRLDRVGPLETPEIVRIGRQIAEGLAAAHARGLIHRDVKPGNILLEGEPGEVKITDFGLARAADDASQTQSGVLSGTPMYMAPEQATGESIDHRADLFSLGSVLYVMASGRPPFRASTTYGVLKRVAEDKPRPIHEVIPEVPQWLCDLIARLHAKKPEDRFASAQEVADLLTQHRARLQPPGGVQAPPVVTAAEKRPPSQAIPPAVPAPRPRSRTRRRAAAAAVLLMLLGGLGFTEATGVTDFRGTVIRLFSPEGTLVVEVDDPGVSVTIDGPDVVITGAGAREIRLKAGSYTVEASKDGKVVSRELVAVTRNGKRVVRISQAAPPPDAKATRAAADATAWERVVAGLPADQQAKAVGARLKELNPDFDGKVEAAFEDGVVRELRFLTDRVSDISPVRALTRLKSLDCSGSDLGRGQLGARALLPLRGMPLTNLCCRYSPALSDLSPVREMRLTSFDCRHTNVGDADVKNLGGMKDLHWLGLWGTPVTDAGLKELAGLKSLQQLSLQCTQVTDAGMKELAGLHRLVILDLYAVPGVTDAGLEELRGLEAMKELIIQGTSVTDAGAEKLASHLPSLKIVKWGPGGVPRLVFAPFTEADVQRIAALPAAKQVEEVHKELKRRNPGFDGAVRTQTAGGVVTEFHIDDPTCDKVTDISPVRALVGLKSLVIGFGPQMPLSDLSPLRGMKLTELRLVKTRVKDLSPLKDMKLTKLDVYVAPVADLSPLKDMRTLTALYINMTGVTDLSPLKGLKLTALDLGRTQVKDLSPLKDMKLTVVKFAEGVVSDLSPLKDMKLTHLNCHNTPVTDLSPLEGMPLEDVRLTPKNITRGLDILRDMKGLQTIGIDSTQFWPAAEFWDRQAKGEFKK